MCVCYRHAKSGEAAQRRHRSRAAENPPTLEENPDPGGGNIQVDILMFRHHVCSHKAAGLLWNHCCNQWRELVCLSSENFNLGGSSTDTLMPHFAGLLNDLDDNGGFFKFSNVSHWDCYWPPLNHSPWRKNGPVCDCTFFWIIKLNHCTRALFIWGKQSFLESTNSNYALSLLF